MIKNTKIIEIVEQDMCDLFRFSCDQMFEFKLECGNQYLDRRFEFYPEMRQTLAYSAVFWKWWRMIWTNRDRKLHSECTKTKWGITHNKPIDVQDHIWHITNHHPWEKVTALYKDFHYSNTINMTMRPNNSVIDIAKAEQEQ